MENDLVKMDPDKVKAMLLSTMQKTYGKELTTLQMFEYLISQIARLICKVEENEALLTRVMSLLVEENIDQEESVAPEEIKDEARECVGE